MPGHPRWKEFLGKLEGPSFLTKEEDDEEGFVFNCDGSFERPLTRKLLLEFEGIDVDASLEYFQQHGGYCDCEVLFNVH